MSTPLYTSVREVLKSRRFAVAYGMSQRNLRRQLVSGVGGAVRTKADELFRKYFRKRKRLKAWLTKAASRN